MQEQNGATFTEYVYALGEKLALMNGQTQTKAFVPLPGGTQVKYTGTPISTYRLPDWLGSLRVGSNPNRTYSWGVAFAPYGERYATSGSPAWTFTGQTSDVVSDEYDFMFREYHSTQGRWISPDPAGIAAVRLGTPQTWNRYAYVSNNPLSNTDSLGLFDDAIGSGCSNGFVAYCPSFFQSQLDASNRNPDFSFGAWADFNDRQTFGDHYYDLPGHSNPVEQARQQYLDMVALTIDEAKKKPKSLRLESRCSNQKSLGQTLDYTLRNTYGGIVSADDEWDIVEHLTPDTSEASSSYGPGTSFQTGNQFLDEIRVGAGQKSIV